MDTTTLSEQEMIRRESLKELRQMGIDPFPAAEYVVTDWSENIKSTFSDTAPQRNVSIAGRLMSRRIMGKASFASLQDSRGRIQLYITRDDLCPGDNKDMYNKVFKRLLDIGDIIGVEGFVFRTKTGEISVHVERLTLLAKCLSPLPIVKYKDGVAYDRFDDPEQRYRKRYLDLIVNDGVIDTFRKRAAVISSLRRQLDQKGYTEVETPVLQAIPGGASARPFITHYNALDNDMYMRIATELYLKRLIVGGFEGVYEIGKNFRNEGMDSSHNPEFTCLELYVQYKDYLWMMTFTENLIAQIAIDVNGSTDITVGGNKISLQPPYKRISIVDTIRQRTGTDITGMSEEGLRQLCKEHNIEVSAAAGKGKIIDTIFGAVCEGELIQPTFVTDYPVEMSPLTKMHRSKEGLTERFELMIGGKEIANAYSELNDPDDQQARFEEQMRLAGRGDDEAMTIDHDFLQALRYGMPPTSGIGMGVDRLVMLLTGKTAIQEVLLFPQLRPHH